MLYPNLVRGQLETRIEFEMVALAETLLGDDEAELQRAYDYDPAWFGGEFPAGGFWVREVRGTGRAQDRGNRPGTVEAVACFYYPAMPIRGLRSKQEDGQQKAKRITRDLRDKFLVAMFDRAPDLYAVVTILNSRGGAADEFGVARTSFNRRGEPEDILWTDRTIMEFSV